MLFVPINENDSLLHSSLGISMGLTDVHTLHIPPINHMEGESSNLPWSWKEEVVSGPWQGPRKGHSVSCVGYKLLIYGGTCDGSHELGDVAVLDPRRDRCMWSVPEIMGVPPGPRRSHDSRIAGGRIFMSGGIQGGTQLNRKADVHELIII